MSQRTIGAGNEVFVGKPAIPIAAERLRLISELLLKTTAVREAHLPQCYIPKQVDPAAQVLFVVLDNGTDVARVLEGIGAGINGILPAGEHLDVIPLSPDSHLLAAVRKAGCVVTSRQKQWWNFW